MKHYNQHALKLGGNVTSSGSSGVTSRGIIYSDTNSNLILGGNDVTNSPSGTGIGEYNLNVTDDYSATPGNLVYVRAYAANSNGTSYGSIKTITRCKRPVEYSYMSYVTYTENPIPFTTTIPFWNLSLTQVHQVCARYNQGLIGLGGITTYTTSSDDSFVVGNVPYTTLSCGVLHDGYYLTVTPKLIMTVSGSVITSITPWP